MKSKMTQEMRLFIYEIGSKDLRRGMRNTFIKNPSLIMDIMNKRNERKARWKRAVGRWKELSR